MTEEKTTLADKPRKLWNGALKMVKGENPNQLIEQFTAEMTLVAEGLCEDQTRLRSEVDNMITEEDRRIQKLQTQVDQLETSLDEERNAHDRDLTELRTRIAALEKKSARDQSRESAKNAKEKKSRTVIRDLTWLVGIAGGSWIIVTLLNLIK